MRRTIVSHLLLAALLCIPLCMTSPPAARADSWLPPSPKIFASKWGEYGCKLMPLPGKELQFNKPAMAELFRLDKGGKPQRVRKLTLVNIPHRAMVSDDGKFLVTIDTYGRLGYDHSLVIYGKDGLPVRDFDLEDLLTEEEIKKVPTTVSSRWWSRGTRFRFADDQEHFILELPSNRTLRINLSTGKVAKE